MNHYYDKSENPIPGELESRLFSEKLEFYTYLLMV